MENQELSLRKPFLSSRLPPQPQSPREIESSQCLEDRPTEYVETAEVEFTPGVWPKEAPPMRYVAVRFTAKQGRLFADGAEVKHLAVVSNREDLL